MSATWGNNIRLTIFGESHGHAIGGVIDGIPEGISLDMERIESWMARRAPGSSDMATARKEADTPEILSGIFDGITTGAPIGFMIRNQNTHSSDYADLQYKMRPSHADYPAYIKHRGFHDYRGGGKFSGRLTATLVFAGAICEQILRNEGIYSGSYVRSIGTVDCGSIDENEMTTERSELLKNANFPVENEEKGKMAHEEIVKHKETMDSVGGVIECQIHGLPVGLGNPFFDSFESVLSHLLFSVPAVKGVEFGSGFEIAKMSGSTANDALKIQGGKIVTSTNHNGGITGGMTNGMPVVFRVAVKPTPSIGLEQETVDIEKMENTKISVHGRHDPCIVPRAVAVIEACALLCALDTLLEEQK